MNHIVRNATLCGDDWCDAKKEIERLKAQVALLRDALEKHSAPYLGHDDYVREALEATK